MCQHRKCILYNKMLEANNKSHNNRMRLRPDRDKNGHSGDDGGGGGYSKLISEYQ